jgi:hypothetical protein
MTQHMLAIAFVAAFLALTATPVRATECVEAHVTPTAESGEQAVRSCTPAKPREQDVADRGQQSTGDRNPKVATQQSAQTR